MGLLHWLVWEGQTSGIGVQLRTGFPFEAEEVGLRALGHWDLPPPHVQEQGGACQLPDVLVIVVEHLEKMWDSHACVDPFYHKSSLQLRVKDDVTGAVSVEAKPLTMLTVLLLISHSTFSGMWTLEKRCRTVDRATCLMASNFIVSGSEQLSYQVQPGCVHSQDVIGLFRPLFLYPRYVYVSWREYTRMGCVAMQNTGGVSVFEWYHLFPPLHHTGQHICKAGQHHLRSPALGWRRCHLMKLTALHGQPVLMPVRSDVGRVNCLPQITWMKKLWHTTLTMSVNNWGSCISSSDLIITLWASVPNASLKSRKTVKSLHDSCLKSVP